MLVEIEEFHEGPDSRATASATAPTASAPTPTTSATSVTRSKRHKARQIEFGDLNGPPAPRNRSRADRLSNFKKTNSGPTL